MRPEELVREYQAPDGTKVREVGPIVYGYSMTIGPDGKPHISQFGNVKNFAGGSNNKNDKSHWYGLRTSINSRKGTSGRYS